VAAWIAERSGGERLVEAPRPVHRDLLARTAFRLERLTGWRPFEFRNYQLVG
jgi:hypothetical protein